MLCIYHFTSVFKPRLPHCGTMNNCSATNLSGDEILRLNISTDSYDGSGESGSGESGSGEVEYVWEYHPLTVLDNQLFMSIGVTILIIGTIGNVLSLCVWLCSSLRKHTLAPYMTTLAIGDLLSLYARLLLEIIAIKTEENVYEISAVSCYIFFYSSYISGHLVGWSLTLMTIQKAIAVCIPLKARRFITRKSGWITMIVLVIVIMGINIHVFWTITYDPLATDEKCYLSNEFITDTWPWIDAALAVFLPFLGLTISNIIIISKLVAAKRRRTKMSTSKVTTDSNLISNCATLITLSLAFLLLNLPLQMYIPLYNNNHLVVDEYTDAFLMTAFLLLQYTNSAINFFVYCLAWPAFRQKLAFWFCRPCIWWKKRHDEQRNMMTSTTQGDCSQTQSTQSVLNSTNNINFKENLPTCNHSNVTIDHTRL